MVHNRSQVKCFNCAAYSHFANECRKVRKNRQQRGEANLAQVNDEEPALLMAMCDNVKQDVTVVIEVKTTNTFKERDDNIWYLDNGASNHMTGRREKFEKLDKIVKGEVKFGDDSLVRIEGKGSIRIMCKNGETRVLHGVYIPTLRSNIISLGQLSEEGNRVVMNGENLWVYDSCGRLLIQVQRSVNRLYKIHIQEAEHYCLLTKSEEEIWLWHK
ncbi:uncharacterized protein LOC141705482 [Apium graveolens]|uniref:uncharacterized protein LOC141705482 n=1 Tax=Apium graveolens TaxID=4045 RepID=UPI003D78B8A5